MVVETKSRTKRSTQRYTVIQNKKSLDSLLPLIINRQYAKI